jgi:hypothetical protein
MASTNAEHPASRRWHQRHRTHELASLHPGQQQLTRRGVRIVTRELRERGLVERHQHPRPLRAPAQPVDVQLHARSIRLPRQLAVQPLRRPATPRFPPVAAVR